MSENAGIDGAEVRSTCCAGDDCHAQSFDASVVTRSGCRSFGVQGLDCAEEVAVLRRAVGPLVGGADNLAFDVLNGRMTVLDGAPLGCG